MTATTPEFKVLRGCFVNDELGEVFCGEEISNMFGVCIVSGLKFELSTYPTRGSRMFRIKYSMIFNSYQIHYRQHGDRSYTISQVFTNWIEERFGRIARIWVRAI